MSDLDDAVDFETLMREHDRIGQLGAALAELCAAAEPRAEEASALLATLSVLVGIHVAKEDRAIYPHLRRTRDLATAPIAEAAVEEFRGLLDSWGDYIARWTGERIAGDWPAFVAQTGAIMERVGRRVRQENELLYPLALREGQIRLRPARHQTV